MLENDQSIKQGTSQLREQINEVRQKITDSSFKISETCGPGDRNYELRHYRGSMIRWQENGGVLLIAHSATLAPNEGYLDVTSTGYMHFVSDHNIKLIAEGHKVTGGGEAWSEEEKSVDIFGSGDIVIQSNGKGGIVINAAQDIELSAGGSIIMKAAEQISLNTGSQDALSSVLGLSESVGSGKLSISTGQYELSTASFKEVVTGSKVEENNGEVQQSQKSSLTNMPAVGPGGHITTLDTDGSLKHVIGHDYILEVGGKMKVKVQNSPEKIIGALQKEMPDTALKYEVFGCRQSFLNPDPKLMFAQDYVKIPSGNAFFEIDAAMPGATGFSVGTMKKGDIVLQSTLLGHIGLQCAGPSPSNVILAQNNGGSIRIEALGAMGMVQMLATKEISATAIKINLN